jgi:hypothetical protein
MLYGGLAAARSKAPTAKKTRQDRCFPRVKTSGNTPDTTASTPMTGRPTGATGFCVGPIAHTCYFDGYAPAVSAVLAGLIARA